MAESHVVTALIGKRAELAGLIAHHQKEMGRLAEDLAHLDATLQLFTPEIDLRTIRVKVHRVRSRFFRLGECQRRVLDFFREAQGAALSSRQIGETLVARQGLEPTTVTIEQMRKNTLAVVHCLERTGPLIPAGRDRHGALERSPDAFTPPGFPPVGDYPASTRTHPDSPGHGRTCRGCPGRCRRCSSAGCLPGRPSA